MTDTHTDTAPIVRAVDLGAEPERVFELLTDPDELVRWWPDVAEIDPREGGRIRFSFRGGEAVVEGEITRYDPPHALGLSWRPSARPEVETRVDFTVTPLDGDRSRLEVVHSGWEAAPELRPMHDAGWAHFLGCLDDLAAGRPVEKAPA